MRATVDFIQRSFAYFNKLCFNGSLPPIPIKLSNARTFLGKVTFIGKRNLFGKIVRFENFTLRISTAFELTDVELEDVILHEMIHYHILLNGIKDSSAHGREFRKMMREFNLKFGRNITISHHLTPAQRITGTVKNRTNYFCVSQLSDGNWGITVCANTRLFEIHRSLPRYYKLQSMTWYGSADPFFNRFPRSKTPKIYKITKEELDTHLRDAQLFKCDGHTLKAILYSENQ